jgi:cell division protein FtsB
MKYKYLNITLFIFMMFLFINVVRSWFQLQKRAEIIANTEKKLEDLKHRNDSLKRDLARVEGREYIEMQARNKLNLGKEDEVVVFLPTVSPYEEPTPTPTEIPNNWLKWIREFSK